MNRNKFGQFVGSLWARFVHAVKVVVIWLFVLSFIVGGIYVYTSYKKVMAYDTTPTVEAPQSLDQRWDENYKKDVESEMNRPGFKTQIELYARQKAEENVQHAYVTKLQQKVK